MLYFMGGSGWHDNWPARGSRYLLSPRCGVCFLSVHSISQPIAFGIFIQQHTQFVQQEALSLHNYLPWISIIMCHNLLWSKHSETTLLSGIVSWLTQSDQSDFSIGGVYFSYTPPRRCIFFAWGLDLLRTMGPWYKSVTSLAAHKFHPSKTPILT